MQSRENGRVRTQNGSCNLACLAQTSNVHQQLRFLAGIWTTAISYKSKAALSMWTFLGGNTQRVHFFYFIDSASIRGYTAVLKFIWQQNPEGSRLVIKRDGFQTKAHKA